jgi:hypothetical protein
MERSINLIYDDVENVSVYADESARSAEVRRKYKRNGQLASGIDTDFGEGWFEVIGSYELYSANFFHIDEVEKRPNEKFYYIISTGGELKKLIKKIGGILPLTERIKVVLKKSKNLKIIFMNSHECDTPDVLEFMDSQIKSEGLDTSQFYLINNNYKLKEKKEEISSNINVHNIKHLPKGNISLMSKFKHEIQNDKLFNFMCFNRNPGAHRVVLLSMLFKRELIHSFDWSLLRGFMLKNMLKHGDWSIEKYLKDIVYADEIEKYAESVRYFANLGVRKSRMESYLEIPETPIPHNDLPGEKIFLENPYQKSYINVTTETSFWDDVIHITEKTFIPFYFYQLSIIVGNYQMVKKIREEFNFDLFDDFIDHSYDNEPNARKRMEMIVNEIERLNKNPEKIKEFYIENNHRLIYNNQRCLEIAQGKTDDVDFFNSLL